MLDIIIYGDDNELRQKNISCVNRLYTCLDVDYRIHSFDVYNKDMQDVINDNHFKKIYILNVDMTIVSGLKVASLIRQNDFDSIIILIINNKEYISDVFDNKLLILDYICNNNGYEKRLKGDLELALKIIFKNKIFNFKYNHCIYRIPYIDINYIEKEPLIKRCIIHTVSGSYYIVNSIEKIAGILGNNFLKTHQSCIVNICNVKQFDLTQNKIIFKNNSETLLVSSCMKNKIKKIIDNNNL